MSILDGMISNQADLDAALVKAAPMAAEMFSKLQLNERTRSAIDLMNEGLSLGDIVGIKKDHRDALLVTAGRLMQAGDLAKAKDTLMMLHIIEPLDERSLYMLAAVSQLQGDFATAAKLYIQFLALDATNPEGYLRLGECLLGAQEFKEARDTFETAREMARAAGNVKAAETATRMMDLATESAASAS